MKARTVILHGDDWRFCARAEEMTQTDVDALKMKYERGVNSLDHLSFYDDDGAWYCFPRKVLDRCILCVEVVEAATVPEAGAEAEAGGECT